MKAKPTIGHKEIGAFLEERVRQLGGNAPVFYSDLAAHFGMPPVTEAWSAHPLCGILGQLDEEDARLRQPFRTTLVISKERNMPGDGFFKTYLGLNPHVRPPKTDNDKMNLFVTELNRVLSHYAPSSHSPSITQKRQAK